MIRKYTERERANMTQEAHDRYYKEKNDRSHIMLGYVLVMFAIVILTMLGTCAPEIIKGVRSYF